MRQVSVHLGERSYTIHIGSAFLSRIGSMLKEFPFGKKVAVLTHPSLESLYRERVDQGLKEARFQSAWISVPEGETSKSMKWAETLYGQLIHLGLDRRSPLLAFGGGVIGDLGGFVAATYMRGIPYIQIPTSLLAQVDASVGGKTAIDHPLGKNMIGAFYQPKAVFIDLDVLHTLPKRELISGLAEVIKYGVIADEEFFRYLEGHASELLSADPQSLARVVETSCAIKADVVEQDERDEGGARAILNFGHTIGHAVENLSGYQYTHGEAIAIGMTYAAKLSYAMQLCSSHDLERLITLIERVGLPTTFAHLESDQVSQALYRDKKVVNATLRFLLMKRIGHVELRDDVPDSLLRSVLSESS